MSNGQMMMQNHLQQQQHYNSLLNARRASNNHSNTGEINANGGLGPVVAANGYTQQNHHQAISRGGEPEIDRYKIKLENSQHDASSYFKNKRQSELLSQTQDLKNANRLMPINNSNKSNRKPY